ncbi:hypothetical protein M427DRAFT_69101 [Gonapodya prolifera JEL478]|uniref:Uncharacterized protein n=1 Tax=Gonapodya prolifera (strain JEL478) TaxID=1344416 RepID=A0A139AIA8_GONPJ|nr:hypothetical protein M427DRAFT_69101 [Gonapodya prolifera JEL478]|eukprot:KXS16542.1 hypothetical protein M427DRAFT_69101 [Gonapodya prolifera JEL478]
MDGTVFGDVGMEELYGDLDIDFLSRAFPMDGGRERERWLDQPPQPSRTSLYSRRRIPRRSQPPEAAVGAGAVWDSESSESSESDSEYSTLIPFPSELRGDAENRLEGRYGRDSGIESSDQLPIEPENDVEVDAPWRPRRRSRRRYEATEPTYGLLLGGVPVTLGVLTPAEVRRMAALEDVDSTWADDFREGARQGANGSSPSMLAPRAREAESDPSSEAQEADDDDKEDTTIESSSATLVMNFSDLRPGNEPISVETDAPRLPLVLSRPSVPASNAALNIVSADSSPPGLSPATTTTSSPVHHSNGDDSAPSTWRDISGPTGSTRLTTLWPGRYTRGSLPASRRTFHPYLSILPYLPRDDGGPTRSTSSPADTLASPAVLRRLFAQGGVQLYHRLRPLLDPNGHGLLDRFDDPAELNRLRSSLPPIGVARRLSALTERLRSQLFSGDGVSRRSSASPAQQIGLSSAGDETPCRHSDVLLAAHDFDPIVACFETPGYLMDANGKFLVDFGSKEGEVQDVIYGLCEEKASLVNVGR